MLGCGQVRLLNETVNLEPFTTKHFALLDGIAGHAVLGIADRSPGFPAGNGFTTDKLRVAIGRERSVVGLELHVYWVFGVQLRHDDFVLARGVAGQIVAGAAEHIAKLVNRRKFEVRVQRDRIVDAVVGHVDITVGRLRIAIVVGVGEREFPGIGERIEDLRPFVAAEFAAAVVGQ